MTVSFAQMTITGAVMIAVIVLLRALLLDRLPKRTFMWLWALAVLRLVLPFGLRLSLNIKLPEQIHEEIVKSYEYDNFLEGFIPIFTENTEEPEKTTVKSETVSNTAATTQSAEKTERTAKRVNVPLVIYISGAALTAACFGALYIYGYKKFGKAQEVQNEACEYWLKGHKIRRRLQIRELSCITSPMTYGVIRPKILVPEDFDWHDSKTVKFVLEHEFQHVKRLDSARKLILCGVLCMHWFNPLVWLMYFLVNRDIELCCDEAVIGALGIGERAAYARSLIAIEADRTGYLTFAYFGQGNIKRRIISIMKIKKRTALSIISAVLIVTLLGACAAVTEIGTTEPEQPDEPTATPAAPIQTVTYDEPEEEAIDYSGRIPITISGLDDNMGGDLKISEAIDKFNRENPDYYVSLVTNRVPRETLMKQIKNGVGPDIIICNYSEDLEANGFFMNLYDFMENDSEITKDDLILTQAMEYYDGALYALGPEIQRLYAYAGLTSKVGDFGDNWTLENWETCAEGFSDITNDTSEDIVYEYFYNGNFYENMESVLTLAKREYIKYELNGRVMSEYHIKKGIKNGDLMLYLTEVNSAGDIESLEETFGEDITLLGLPEFAGYVKFEGKVGISTGSENQEGAWEFIKCLLSVGGEDTTIVKSQRKQYSAEADEKFYSFAEKVTAEDGWIYRAGKLAGVGLYEFLTDEITLKECMDGIDVRRAVYYSWSPEPHRLIHPVSGRETLTRCAYQTDKIIRMISLDEGETWYELIKNDDEEDAITINGELVTLAEVLASDEPLTSGNNTDTLSNPVDGTAIPASKHYLMIGYSTCDEGLLGSFDEDGNVIVRIEEGSGEWYSNEWYVAKFDREIGDYLIYKNGEWQELLTVLQNTEGPRYLKG